MAARKDITYTEEQRDEIVAHVLVQVSCGRSVVEIMRDDPNMPDQATFWRWHWKDEELRGKLADARANGVEARLEEAIDIARNPMLGEIETIEVSEGEEGDTTKTKRVKEDMLGHRRLLVDTLIKSAQMLKPKTYGPKLDLTSDGEKIGVAAELEAARLRARDLLDGKTS